jgi:hypothetical protein
MVNLTQFRCSAIELLTARTGRRPRRPVTGEALQRQTPQTGAEKGQTIIRSTMCVTSSQIGRYRLQRSSLDSHEEDQPGSYYLLLDIHHKPIHGAGESKMDEYPCAQLASASPRPRPGRYPGRHLGDDLLFGQDDNVELPASTMTV